MNNCLTAIITNFSGRGRRRGKRSLLESSCLKGACVCVCYLGSRLGIICDLRRFSFLLIVNEDMRDMFVAAAGEHKATLCIPIELHDKFV